MTRSEYAEKTAREDVARAQHNLRLTSQIAAKMRLEAAVLRYAGLPDNGRLKEADMLMDASKHLLPIASPSQP